MVTLRAHVVVRVVANRAVLRVRRQRSGTLVGRDGPAVHKPELDSALGEVGKVASGRPC